MENDQMKQPTYEELARAYTEAARAAESLRMELQAIKSDKILERLNTMMHIIEHSDKYPKHIVALANWHAKQILAKPKA